MSRYEIPGKESRYRLVVGWDRPLCTYFAQVWDERSPEVELEEDAICLWVGCTSHEVPTPENLAELVRFYVDLPRDVIGRLRSDREARK